MGILQLKRVSSRVIMFRLKEAMSLERSRQQLSGHLIELTLKFMMASFSVCSDRARLMILFMVFCGLVCPVEFMSSWVQMISKVLPLTYCVSLMRSSLIGTGTVDVTYNILALLVLGAFYVAVGALTLRLIERNLRKKALFSVF
jgi:ABC-type uncharacterized transport system permease subunit